MRGPSAIRSTVSKQPSVRDNKSILDSAFGEGKRDLSQPFSRQHAGNGSVRGASITGSVKGESKPALQLQRSIRRDRSELDANGDSGSVTGKPTKSALDDTKSSKGGAVPVEDVSAQKKLDQDSEIGAPPTPAKSTASIRASASLWSEKPSLPDLPPLLTLPGEFLMGALWF